MNTHTLRAALTALSMAITAASAHASAAWLNTWDGSAADEDWPSAITVDDLGNSYVAGTSIGVDGSQDALVVAHERDGTEIWSVSWSGAAGGDDGFADVVVRGDGAVFVTGWTTTVGDSTDYVTMKLDATGVIEWTATYDGPDAGRDEGLGLTLIAGDSLAVAGMSETSSGQSELAIVAYDDLGAEAWVTRYADDATTYHEPVDILTAPGGTILVVDWSRAGSEFSDTYSLQALAFGPDGSLDWSYTRAGTAGSSQPLAAGVDAAGNLAVTGFDQSTGGDLDVVTLSLDPTGAERWVETWAGDDDGDDLGADLVVIANGSVLVTGSTVEADGLTSVVTLKYGAAGGELWAATYDDGALESGVAIVEAATTGDIYVAGGSDSPENDGTGSSLVLRYSPGGTLDLVESYTLSDSSWASATAAVADRIGTVVVAGVAHAEAGNLDLIVGAYDGSVVGVESPGAAAMPASVALLQNAPNPFNPVTSIGYEIPAATHVTLRVFDVGGREVARLVDGARPPGRHRVRWHADRFASGVYFYRLETPSRVIERKLTLLR